MTTPLALKSLLLKTRTGVGEAILEILGCLEDELCHSLLIMTNSWQIEEGRLADHKIRPVQTVTFMKSVTGWKWLSSWQLCLVRSGIAQTNSWKVLTGLPQVCSWLLAFLMLKGEDFSRYPSTGRSHGHFKSCNSSAGVSTTWQGDSWSSHVLLSKNSSHRLCATGRLLGKMDSDFHWQRTWINYTNCKLNLMPNPCIADLGPKSSFLVWNFTMKSITKTIIAASTKSKRGSNILRNFRWIFGLNIKPEYSPMGCRVLLLILFLSKGQFTPRGSFACIKRENNLSVCNP